MKKLTALLLSLAMVFSLAACGNTANTPADTSKVTPHKYKIHFSRQ